MEIMDSDLDNLFDEYISKKSIFSNKEALLLRYFPENIPHRSEQIKKLGMI